MITPPSGGDASRESEKGAFHQAPARVSAAHTTNERAEEGKSGVPITPAFVWRCVQRWWKIATPIGIVLAVASGLYVYLRFEPAFRSDAWLRIEEQATYIVSRVHTTGTNTFVQTQAQLIRSPIVLDRVIADPQVGQLEEVKEHPDPITYLLRRIRVSARANSEIFIIGFEYSDAKNSAMVANKVVESYFKVQSESEADRTRKIISLLEDESKRRQVIIRRYREDIHQMTKDKTTKPLEGGALGDEQTLRLPLEQLHSRITSLEVEQEIVKARLKAYEDSIADREIEVDEEAVEEEIHEDQRLRQLANQNFEQSKYLKQLEAAVANPKSDPRYKQLYDAYENSQKKVSAMREALREKIVADKREEAEIRRNAVAGKMRKRINDSTVEIDVLRKRYFEQLNNVSRATGRNLDVEFKRSELTREEKVFDQISARISRLRTEMRAPARIQLLRSATPPKTPTARPPYKKIGVFALAGLLFPFGLVVLWERFVCRIDGPQQLWQANLKVVGEVARLPVQSRVSALAPYDQIGRDVSLFEESIDSLRTCLVLAESSQRSQVLVVSSAVSGEGKTSVAAQLAVSLARASGEPTLLIDADMRSPDIHNVFDIPNEPGLAQVLSHECTAEDAIVTSWSNYVHLLPAGVLKASPHKLLGDGALKSLLTEVRSAYHHIIIDTSPILSASESLVLAKAADATLLCAMRDISRLDQVQKAYERLVNTGARTLGTVLNGVPTGRYAYLYGIYAYPRN